MSAFDNYVDRYTLVRLTRRDGILQITFHTDGGSLRWGAEAISQMQAAFADVADDPENRVVILTGAGDEFNGPKGSPATFPGATPRGWEAAHFNTRRLLRNLLEIEAPVIAAINGPVWRHC